MFQFLRPLGIYIITTLITFTRPVKVQGTFRSTGTATFDGDVEIAAQYVKGSRQALTMTATAAAQFIAPAACEVIEVKEIHGTVSSGACTYNVEKLTGTQAPGGGTAILSVGFDCTATINTVVSKTAFTGTEGINAVLAAGNRLAPVVASGSASGLAGMNLTVIIKWL